VIPIRTPLDVADRGSLAAEHERQARPTGDEPTKEPGAFGAEPYLRLLEQLEAGVRVTDKHSTLVEEALAVWTRPGFDTFVCRPRLRFKPFPYQLRAASRALREMRGRAILADEVGLGKTIEAGIFLSELRLRGLAQQTLVLVPTGLLEQWQEELDRKFALPSLLLAGASWEPTLWSQDNPILIASLPSARRAPLRDALVANSWDLVIVDEAHRLKNPRSASATLLRELRSRYLLLLTATPVENRIDDLFQLVTLVRPGHVGTPSAFRRHYGSARTTDTIRYLPELPARMREVMIRHRRSEVALMLPRRLAETVRVEPGLEERELYRVVAERVREQGRNAPVEALALRTVQRIAGSCPPALGRTLEAVGWLDLAMRAATLQKTEKVRHLVQLLKRHHAQGEKVVVFTAFRDTLEFLGAAMGANGILAAVYHGGLSRKQKEAAIQHFGADLPVLISSEAGGEGRNLQFCHVMVNFDLPWNPMRIEQRLGRIHRIGQDHDVLLYNLVLAGSIEDRILQVLQAKINLFELVVGELDMILGRIEDEFDFESAVFKAYIESQQESDFADRLEKLGEALVCARTDYLESRRRMDALVGETGTE
jgi:SNF2 family DNA or RNA helicase